ncbi:MAG: O-acetyl-ADP-ribose deacetylase [Acidobacteriota bacterium]|nr:O-acetyl-ADP-ribose deacetylase [Acidobacteriota bacterium]
MNISVTRGDITRFAADVIVNAANSQLAGGGGVDGAIHRAAGPTVMAELDLIRAEIGHCPTGGAVITKAGRLNARYIIHAVGPVYRGGQGREAELLSSCYREALRLAGAKEAKSIAFPAISTGVYGYPLHEAAQVAVHAVKTFAETPGSIETVTFVLYSDAAFETFRCALLV